MKAATRRAAWTERKRLQRYRERHGLVPLDIAIHFNRFVEALLITKRLSEEQALRRDIVARAAGAALDEISERWMLEKVTE